MMLNKVNIFQSLENDKKFMAFIEHYDSCARYHNMCFNCESIKECLQEYDDAVWISAPSCRPPKLEQVPAVDPIPEVIRIENVSFEGYYSPIIDKIDPAGIGKDGSYNDDRENSNQVRFSRHR